MIKKLVLVLVSFCWFAFGQETLTIDEAIDEAMKYVSSKLTVGTKVLVLNIETDSPKLSDYVIDESNMFIMNNTKLSLVENKENAQSIISGNITKLGDNYRFRVQVKSAANGNNQGMQSFNVKENDILKDLLGAQAAPVTQPIQQTSSDTTQELPQTPPESFIGNSYIVDNHRYTYTNMYVIGNDTTFAIDVEDANPKPKPVAVTTPVAVINSNNNNVKSEDNKRAREPMRGVGLFSVRYETSLGLAVGSIGGKMEFGGIAKNGFYITYEGGGGSNGYGGLLNLGGTIGGDRAVKNIFGASMGLWNQEVQIYGYGSKYWNDDWIYEMGFGGVFHKLLLGNERVNFDITNKLLFGARKDIDYNGYNNSYSYEEGGTVIWQISLGFTFLGDGRGR